MLTDSSAEASALGSGPRGRRFKSALSDWDCIKNVVSLSKYNGNTCSISCYGFSKYNGKMHLKFGKLYEKI